MLGTGRDFNDISDLVEKYFSLDRLPTVEKRVLEHPTRLGKFEGPRNENGYRSDPFDQRGDFNIAFLGCSWVEGSGVAYDEVFTVRVKKKLEAETGLKVMNWNLGLAAMGMDYLVRIAPAVCNTLRPDLIVVIGTWADRMEHFSADGKRIALYNPVPILVRNGRLDVSEQDRKLAFAYETLSSAYQDLSSHIQSFASLEGIFGAARIPWIYSWIDKPKASEPIEKMQEAGLLPEDRYLGSYFKKTDDAGPTNKHPGPDSHELFATKIIKCIEQSNLMQTGRSNLPSKIQHWARKSLSKWRPRQEPAKNIEDDGDDIYPIW